MSLQVFYPYGVRIHNIERTTDLLGLPAVRENTGDFRITITHLVSSADLKLDEETYADTFGILLRETLADKKFINREEALQNIKLADLAAGQTTSKEHDVGMIDDADHFEATIKRGDPLSDEAKVKVRRVLISERSPINSRRALEVVTDTLIENAGQYTRMGGNCRSRYFRWYGKYSELGAYFELSLSTLQTTFKTPIIETTCESLRLAGNALNALPTEERKDVEGLYFAIFPGFSSFAGVNNPSIGQSGMALFLQTQLARVAGVVVIVSGHAMLTMGKHQPDFGFPSNWEAKISLLGASFPGSSFGFQFRLEQLYLYQAVLHLSQVCASKFFEDHMQDFNLETYWASNGELADKYAEYLLSEKDTLNMYDLAKAPERLDQRHLREVKERLLSASSAI